MEKRFSRRGLLAAFLLLLPLIPEAQIAKAINTPINDPTAADGCPSLSADGNELVLMSDRERKGYVKIYHSKRISTDRWNPPRQVLPDMYDKGFVGGAYLSFDATSLFFHSSIEASTVGVEDIYFSKKEGENWGSPQNIGEPVNSPAFEGYPSLSPDGDQLYFVRLKKSQSNCPVVMMAVKGRDGKWMKPIELPPTINRSCETTPRILADGKTLIFASDRAGGKGGFDLYQSRRDKDGQWSDPVNLAYLNTEDNDYSAAYSPDDHTIVYQSKDNIMQSTLPEHQTMLAENFCAIKGYTKDGVSYKAVPSNISIRNLSASRKPIYFSNDSLDGSYSAILKPGFNYALEVKAPGYLPARQEINLATATTNEVVEANFDLLPETIELHYSFRDSLSGRPIKPDFALFSVKDKTIFPFTFDARNNIYKARVKLKQKYQVEASMEGYPNLNKVLFLENLSSYKPVRFEEVMRRKYYLFTFKAVEANTSRAVPGAELTITDLDTQTRLFPLYDAASQAYHVELEETGKYQLKLSAEGYQPKVEVIDSYELIRSEKLRKEIELDLY